MLFSGDAEGVTAGREDGGGAVQAMEGALGEAGVVGSQVWLPSLLLLLPRVRV